ncbi:hypothetical protein Tco_0845357 [Tanacetum coccineum]
MDEDIQEPETEETQTHHSIKTPTEEPHSQEHESPSPPKEQPESSKAKETDASDSGSSCSKTFRPYDNYMPITKRKLVRNLQHILEVLYAQVAEDHWDKHEEAAASYVDFKAAVDAKPNDLAELLWNAKLPEILNQLNAFQSTLNTLSSQCTSISESLKEEPKLSRKFQPPPPQAVQQFQQSHCLKSMQLLRGEFIETDGGLVKPPSYTKGEQLSSEETIKEAQTEHVEKEPKVEDVEMEHAQKPQLVKASSKVYPNPDAPVYVPFEINGKLYHLTNKEIQAHYKLEERNQNAVEEAKLLEMNKSELIKFRKIQDAEIKVLNREHSEKIRKARELRKKNIDQYRWATSNRLKPKTITDIHIHPNTKPVIVTVFRGNDRGNFDVFNPFKFGYFGVTELDELGLIIQKKKNNVVGDLITSLGKRKREIQELESETRIPGLECNRSLLEGIPFVNNLVIEQPENEMFFIDVFGDEAFQRMSDIHKVDVETLLTYLVMSSNIIPNNFEDPVLPPTTSTSSNIRKSQPISKKTVSKNSNLGKEASASLNNITAEKHDALMDMEALKETLRAEREEKAMVEEILRKQVEDEKAWEDYENAFKGLDDGLEDAVRIRPFVNDDISEFKDFEQEKQEPNPILLVISDVEDIPTQESHVKRGKKAVSEEAPPFRIFVKNRGRSEWVAKLQGKNFKFD